LFTIKVSLASYPLSDWYYYLVLAIIPTLLGFSLLNWSIKWVSANTILVVILFEPVGAIILVYYILHEKVVITQIIGSIVIMVEIILFLLERRMNQIGVKKELKPAS
jgi:drug/metabolite transporter (DMT)-like permease